MLYHITVVSLLWASLLQAQSSMEEKLESPQTRTDLINMLNLQKAQTTLKDAKELEQRLQREYEESQRLFDQSIISKKELDETLSAVRSARQAQAQARIDLNLTKLGFLDNATHITVMEAKKYYDPNGRRKLDLVLKNTSNLAQAEAALTRSSTDDTDLAAWQTPQAIRDLLNIENIFISVEDEQASIAKPYEQVVSQLPYGDKVQLSFTLLTDVQQAGIRMQYLDKDHIERVTLEKESLQKRPTMVASQLSLEGPLGSDVSYDLNLEMLVTDERVFSLAVTNMLPQIACSFVENGSRITSIRFSEDLSTHNLLLNVSIPDKLKMDWIDHKIDFQIWAVTSTQMDIITQLKHQYLQEPIPDEALATIKGVPIDLTLIPKGMGRLELLIDNLYREIKPGQDLQVETRIHNDGTLALFHITPGVSPPLGWRVEVTPQVLDRLSPDESQSVSIHLTPGQDVGLGEYEARIKAQGQSGSETIEAVDKGIKIKINAQTHVMTTLLLISGLVILILGIVVMGVRLSHR